VDEFYRFEGMTNPDDSSILFAISSSDGLKGTLGDAYGVYAENLNSGDEYAITIETSLKGLFSAIRFCKWQS
jgi:hypothetical protein